MADHDQDPIRVLIQKIDRGVEEVKCRSVSTLYSKIKNKLLPWRDLPEYYSDLPGSLLQFINEYQLTVPQDVIEKAIQTLIYFSQSDDGHEILNQYGAVEFFCRYKENVNSNKKLESIVETLLNSLVQPNAQNKTLAFSQTASGLRNTQGTANFASFKEEGADREDKENAFGITKEYEKSLTQNYRTKDFYNTKNSQESMYDTVGLNNRSMASVAGNRAENLAKTRNDVDEFGFSMTDPKLGFATTNQNAAQMTQKTKKKFHIESDEFARLKMAKEDFFPVVFVPLIEGDERFLFDVTVQLKYGDQKTVRKILNEQMISLIKDFPLESLLLQSEMLQELFNLMKKSTEDVQYQLTEIFAELLKKIKHTVVLYENPYHANQKEAKQSEEFLITDEKLYIQKSYPTLQPPRTEFIKDPDFKKTQKETFPLNYFLLLDGIVENTIDLVENTYFADNLNKIWRHITDILRKYKYKSVELIEEASKDYLRRFVKELQDIKAENLYGEIEYSYLFNILYSLFRMFSIEEYQEMRGYQPLEALEILFKALYRFIFTEIEVEHIENYSKYLTPETYAKYQKVSFLLNSVVRLRTKELELLKIDFRGTSKQSREIQDIVGILDKVLMAIPYATFPNLVGVYLETYLYSQAVEGNTSDQAYGKCRDMILSLLNVPDQTMRTIIYENMLENLLGEGQFVYNREIFSKKNLTIQTLFDEEILTEMFFASLDNEMTANSMAKILLSFLNQTTANNFDVSRYDHFLNFSTLIHSATLPGDNTGSSITKYESLKPVNYAIYKIVPNALLKNLIADLFAKNQKTRSIAFGYLCDTYYVQGILGGSSKQETLINQYLGLEYDEEGSYEKLKTRKDPLEGFLDGTLKHFVYEEATDILNGSLETDIGDALHSIDNLLKIAHDHAIEYRLRLSSLEQLNEMLQFLLDTLQKPDQGYKRQILSTIEMIANLGMENLIIYCGEKHRDRDAGYVERALGLVNKVLGSKAVPGDVVWTLVGPLYDLNSILFQENAANIIRLLISLLQQRNDGVRYQALLALNYIGLSLRVPAEKLPKGWSPGNAVMSLKRLQEKFFIIGEFDWVEYESKYKDTWSLFPLEEDSDYFVNLHLTNADRLNDPMFSVQDQVLEEKCRDFYEKIIQETGINSTGAIGQKVRHDVLLTNGEKWAKLIPTMELYLPSKLLEINIFSMLTKVYTNALALSDMRAENGIERITKLVEKILSSDVLMKEVRNSESLLQNLIELLEFVASNVLGPLYEIQSDNARAKMDVILNALSVVNGFLRFAFKSKQVKIKHILAKKVIKQSLIDLLQELSTFFNDNEVLYLKIGKLCKNIFRFPEIYLVLNLKPLLGNLFDFMFQFTSLEHFKNKHLARWFLQFFLVFSLQEEGSAQNTVTRNLTQSLSKLSITSQEIVSKSSSIGWLLRISEDRETQIRILAWNLMCNLVNKEIANEYQSSFETALQVLYAPNEGYGVVTNAVNYINKTLDIFMNEEDYEPVSDRLEESVQEGDDKKKLSKRELLRSLYRKNVISRLESMLKSGKKCPPLYLCGLVTLLRNTCVLDSRKAMPVFSQLGIWDLIVELINPKALKERNPGKKMTDWGKEVIELSILVNNVVQLLIFGMSYEKQVGEYLVYSTNLLKVVVKWLLLLTSLQEKALCRDNPQNNFLVDICSTTLTQILNFSICLNEDKAIVMINKLYEDKIQNDSKESKYNVYLLISKLFSATKNDLLILTLFRLLSNLLPKWKKGLHLVETQDNNGETLSESLILNLFNQYKLNDMMLADNKISWDDYLEAKNTMISCTCTLLNTSNPAKLAFMYSGYLSYCLKNMGKAADALLLEDVSPSQTTAVNKRKTQSSFDVSISSAVPLRSTYYPGSQNQSIASEDVKSSIRVLKYFLIEAEAGEFRKEELYNKLEDQVHLIFDTIFKSWRLLSRKEELLHEITKTLCNFASNKQINTLCFTKLADNKSVILNDITNTINKFEAADKQLLKISFEFIRNLSHSKEVRSFLYKSKTLEACVSKLNKIWNGRREWNINNPVIIYIIDLFLATSFFKDSHDRILSEPNLLDQLVNLSDKVQLRGSFMEKIWILIGNLAYGGTTKHFFLKYEKIFAMALSVLSQDDRSLNLKWISTQFFVNILHKCNAAVGLVKKEHIVDQFFYLKKEMERELDKLTFTSAGREENAEKVFIIKNLIDNLNKINLFIKQV